MKTNNIPETLIEDVKEDIIRYKETKTIVKAVIYIALAIVLGILLMTANIDGKSWTGMCLGFVAIVLLIMGGIELFGKKKGMKYKGVKINAYQVYFKNPSTSEISRAIREKDTVFLKKEVNSTDMGLRVNMIAAEDGSLCRYRMYKYVPFDYQPEGEIVELTKEMVKAFAEI